MNTLMDAWLMSSGGFLKWGYPKTDSSYWKVLLKWRIWGYPNFGKPPYIFVYFCFRLCPWLLDISERDFAEADISGFRGFPLPYRLHKRDFPRRGMDGPMRYPKRFAHSLAWDIPLLTCVQVATTGHSVGGWCSAILSPSFAWMYQSVGTKCTQRNEWEAVKWHENKHYWTFQIKWFGTQKQMAKWSPLWQALYRTQTDLSADAVRRIVTIASTKTTGPRPRSWRCRGFSGFGRMWCVSTHHA